MAGALRGLITRAKPTLNRIKEGIKSTGKKLGDLSNESSQPSITKNPTITKESLHDKTKSGFDSKRNEMIAGMATKDSQTLIAIKQELGDIESLLSKQPALFSKLMKSVSTQSNNDNQGFGVDDVTDLIPDKKTGGRGNRRARGGRGLLNKAKSLGGKALKLGGKVAMPAIAAYTAYEGISDISKGGKVGNLDNATGNIKNPLDAIFAAINPSTYMNIGRLVGEEIEENTGIGDSIARLFDEKNTATDTVELNKNAKSFEKSTNAVDKFSKKGVKALTGTSKEFIKTEKSLSENNIELKKTTKEIKDFDVEEMFESIGDKIGGFWEDLKTGASNVMQGGKEAIQKGGQAVSETVGTAMGEGAAALGVPEAQQAKATMERSTNDLPDRSSGKSTKSGKNFDLVDAAMNYKGDKLTGLSEAQTRALVADTQRTESGGDIKAENKYGYIGKYQFGAGALADAGLVDMAKVQAAQKSKDWYNGGQTAFLNDKSNWKIEGGKDTYMDDAAMQDKAYSTYSNNHIKQGMKSGAISENDSPEKIASYVKASHLKGVGGANKLFKSGIDSTDANGTSAGKYAKDAISAIKNLTPEIESAMQNGTVKTTGSSGGEGVVGSAGGNGTPSIVPENLKDVKLKVKSGEATAGGKALSGTTDLAKLAQSKYGDEIKYFSAFNDSYHQKNSPESGHTKGLKFDMVLNDPKKASEMKANIENMAKEVGVPVKVEDEYKNLSKKGTGGHLDVGFKNKEDADKFSASLAQKEQVLIERETKVTESEQIIASKEDKQLGIDKARQGSIADQINKTTSSGNDSQPVVVNNVNNTNNSTVNSGNGDSTGVPLVTRNPDSYVQNVNTSLMYHSMS